MTSTLRWLARVALVVLAALILLLLILFVHRRSTPEPLSDLQVAEAWLECIDCEGPFLQRLHDASSGNDTIVGFLRAALLQGPDSARRARHLRDLLRAWAADSLYRRRLDEVAPAVNKGAYLFRYSQGFKARWRGRAAIALGVIRGDTALAALDSALQVPPADRADSLTQRWIKQARSDSTLQALKPPTH